MTLWHCKFFGFRYLGMVKKNIDVRKKLKKVSADFRLEKREKKAV